MVTIDKRDAQRRADRAIRADKPREALGYLWQLVDRSHVVDEELRGYLTMMAKAYEALRYNRAAARPWITSTKERLKKSCRTAFITAARTVADSLPYMVSRGASAA